MNHKNKGMWLLTVLLLLLGMSASAQQVRKPVTMASVTVEKVLSEIEKNSDYLFMFSDSKIDTQRIVSIRTISSNVEDVMKELFAGTDVVWKIDGGKIILTVEKSRTATAPKASKPEKPLRITGCVKDAADGLPLIGVNVLLKNNLNVGTSTDINGNYIIEAKPGDIVVFNYVGYADSEFVVDGRTEVNIAMKMDTEELNQATVVGYGTQKKIRTQGSGSKPDNSNCRTCGRSRVYVTFGRAWI